MRALLACTALLAACSTAPIYYPTVREQVISLRKGDLEASGIAFFTPSTVTLGAVNKAGLAETYKGMYEEYCDTGLFSAEALRRVATAAGARYVAQLKLQAFNQGAKGRFGFLGLRLVETQYADVRLFLQVWDSRDGSIAWEAMQELRIARESTTEEPLMLRKMLEHSARELIVKLP